MTDKEREQEARAAARVADLADFPLLEDEEKVVAELNWLRVTNAAIQQRMTAALRAGREMGLPDRALADLSGIERRKVKRRIEEGEES